MMAGKQNTGRAELLTALFFKFNTKDYANLHNLFVFASITVSDLTKRR